MKTVQCTAHWDPEQFRVQTTMYSAGKIPFTVQFKQRIRAIETKRIREHKQHDIADHLATIGIEKQQIENNTKL